VIACGDDIWGGIEMRGDPLFKNRYRVSSVRLRSWDYRWAGVYSVTICTLGRVRWLGEIREEQACLSTVGKIVAEEWEEIPRRHSQVSLDEWIIMPDHIHGILIFQGNPENLPSPEQPGLLLAGSLGAVIGQFKSKATKRICWGLRFRDFAWQERFHDTIVRDADALTRLRAYIRENPLRWARKDKK
jgi:putative transposase